ncbi:MAG TPA: kelch repeat-containing protein [Candidatus Binatus sp.]|uniref:Kelch repeat-containing protein n=1 Tax=Candidatus Binatus sp. TaxID=2811406 RepID=UPI002B49F7A2|nr:kelch repeat-containing protein [Candidatus Binatus sp.]HKN14490.1 kelch repeat-containing protein [Candidatus Binatus sp.]
MSLLIAAGLAACAGGGVTEAPPVFLTNPQGNRVEALSMTTPRANAAAIRLRDGHVLICGGTATGEVGGVLSSAELFDPAARTFTPTGSMTVARAGQTITMLRDGRVLVAGGVQNAGFRSQLSSAEIYDPGTGTFSATGSMSVAREGHTATMLRDGRVLIVGGSDNGIHTLDTAEIYDPSSGIFSSTGHLNQPRIAHIAALLGTGKVLIAGGGRGGTPSGYISYDTAEMYDPAMGRFTPIFARMKSDRVGAAAVKLNDGRVLIVGGKSGKVLVGMRTLASMAPLNTAEIYDPESGSFIGTADMSAPHYLATATMLDNGNVLVVGGWTIQGPVVVGMHDAELFVPESNLFSHVGRTNVARLTNTATLLNDGEVLVAGGIADKALITAAVEFYSPTQHRFLMLPETSASTE